MSVRERLCGMPRGDGCGRPIGDAAYVVRYDEDLQENIIYHVECEAKLPPLELWTTVPKSLAISIVASDLSDKVWEEFIESAFAKHGVSIKAKHKKLLEKHPDISDEEIKEAAKRALRR